MPIFTTRRTGLMAAGMVVFLVLFGFHHMSPLSLDDYGFLVRLTASDFITESVEQYYKWDGRIAGYFLNLSILSTPPPVMNFLLPLLQLALIFVIAMHALGMAWKERITGWHILAVACLLWLSVPDVGQTFFWKTGSPYGLIPILFLLLLWPYRVWAEWNEYRARSFWLCVPLAVFCGLADFHNTVAVALLILALSGWTVWRTGTRRIPPFIPPVLLLLCFAVIYTAPGNMLRIAAISPEFLSRSRLDGILEHLGNQGSIQANYLWEYALMAILFFYPSPHARAGSEPGGGEGFFSGRLRAVLPGGPLCMAAGFFLLSQAVQMAFMFSPAPENRVYSSSVMFMIIAALIVHARAREQAAPGMPLRFFWGAAAAVCLVSLAMYGGMYAETKAYADTLARNALRAGPEARLVAAPAPYRAGSHLFYGRQCGIQDDPENWINQKFAEYHRLDSVMLTSPHFNLALSNTAEEGSFQGTVDGNTVSFCYLPAGENKDLPFFLAFPKVPETSLQRRAAASLDGMAPETVLFRYGLGTYYDHVRPGTRTAPEKICGSAELAAPDLAVHGYIVHYRGSEDNVASVVPLGAAAVTEHARRSPASSRRSADDSGY